MKKWKPKDKRAKECGVKFKLFNFSKNNLRHQIQSNLTFTLSSNLVKMQTRLPCARKIL